MDISNLLRIIGGGAGAAFGGPIGAGLGAGLGGLLGGGNSANPAAAGILGLLGGKLLHRQKPNVPGGQVNATAGVGQQPAQPMGQVPMPQPQGTAMNDAGFEQWASQMLGPSWRSQYSESAVRQAYDQRQQHFQRPSMLPTVGLSMNAADRGITPSPY